VQQALLVQLALQVQQAQQELLVLPVLASTFLAHTVR
jgi:hypothetical protein